MQQRAMILAVLAVTLATPVFAQQTGTSSTQSNPQTLQQAQQFAQQWQDAYNRRDARAAANFFSPNAYYSTGDVTVIGRDQIEQAIQNEFAHVTNSRITVDRAEPIGTGGNTAWSEGTWTATMAAETARPGQDLESQGMRERSGAAGPRARQGIERPQSMSGHWLSVLDREGGEWKIHALMSNMGMGMQAPLTGSTTPPTITTPRNQ